MWKVFFKFCIMIEKIGSLSMSSVSFVLLEIEPYSTLLYKNSTTEPSGSRYTSNYQDQYPNFYSYNFSNPFYTPLNIFMHVNCISHKNLINLYMQLKFVSILIILNVCLNTQMLKYTPLSNCIYKLCTYCMPLSKYIFTYVYIIIYVYIWKFNF